MTRYYLSAAHKSSGKTLISFGLSAALRARGRHVQCFKKGPDYIDPLWLSRASGNPCYNLDSYLQSSAEIGQQFSWLTSDVALIEGNKGLYDGLSLDGSNSNAALAKLLNLPVILIIDARGMTRGIAPLLLGYQAFDRQLSFAGVVLNRLGGSRHEQKLRSVIEHYTDMTVLGAIGHDPALTIGERHLGLVTVAEHNSCDDIIRQAQHCVEQSLDLDGLLGTTPTVPPTPVISQAVASSSVNPIRIAIARDAAFCFYYEDDLAQFRRLGVTLVAIDTLRDTQLPPDIDGLFIGGGFPESYAAAIGANRRLKAHINQSIAQGLPVYAECAGLIYLSRSLTLIDGTTYPMVGTIAGDCVLHRRPIGRGYVNLQPGDKRTWLNTLPLDDKQVRCHEFHYCALANLSESYAYTWRVTRGYGIDGAGDGLCVHNTVASFSHLRSCGNFSWVARFVRYIKDSRRCHRADYDEETSDHARPLVANTDY